jgi:GntR family transcriptional regulator/MocR family aminotransferase
VMSLARRVALLDWARRAGAWVVEDDYDTEYRWEPRPLDPLRTLDADGRVVYLGSVTKVLAPWLRIGWVVAADAAREAMLAVKARCDPAGDRDGQLALAAFLDQGRMGRHLRRTSGVYAARRAAVLEGLARIPGWRVVPGPAGLHVALVPLAQVPDGTDDEVARVASARGSALRSIGQVALRCGPGAAPAAGLVVGYGRLPVDDAGPALDVVAGAVADVAADRGLV